MPVNMKPLELLLIVTLILMLALIAARVLPYF